MGKPTACSYKNGDDTFKYCDVPGKGERIAWGVPSWPEGMLAGAQVRGQPWPRQEEK